MLEYSEVVNSLLHLDLLHYIKKQKSSHILFCFGVLEKVRLFYNLKVYLVCKTRIMFKVYPRRENIHLEVAP